MTHDPMALDKRAEENQGPPSDHRDHREHRDRDRPRRGPANA
jgi:hypothetical protein